MKLFVRGDVDGLFALGLDNLLMLILMSSLCLGFPLFFPPELYFQTILPATAVGVIFGNLIYARMALQLAKKENRDDVCAIPYGINLITVIVFVFLVMYPAKLVALGQGQTEAEAARIAWQAGLMACFVSGLLEISCAFFADFIRRITPRAALLAALAAIGLFFIAGDFVFRTYAYPLIGMTGLALTLVFYFGKVQFAGGVPGGVIILGTGITLAWGLHFFGFESVVPFGSLNWDQFGLHVPVPQLGELYAALPQLLPYLSAIIPMGLLSGILSLQNLESAKAAGDDFAAKPALLTNGLGSVIAATLGSSFPTTIYIGHPGWKSIGSRAGYSVLTAIAIGILCFTGLINVVTYLIPIEAGMAILIWIGLMMCSQAFDAIPRQHMPAVAIGLLPGIAAYAAVISKHTLRASGQGTPEAPFPETLVGDFITNANFYAEGMYALEAGYIYTSLILAAATVCIIDRRFKHAAGWFTAGGVLAATGMSHSFLNTGFDIIATITPAWKWTLGYLAMAFVCLLVPFISKQTEESPMPANPPKSE
jgi:AGZA family xanthine/uracil permease-like MFS transporter